MAGAQARNNLELLGAEGDHVEIEVPHSRVSRRVIEVWSDRIDPATPGGRARLAGLLTAAAPPAMVDHVPALMCDVRPAGNRPMLHAMAEADLRDVLPRIKAPTLLLYGGAGERSPLDVGQALHAQIPASTLVVLPGTGHLSNVEGAERFNEEVRAFIRTRT
ncbi:MAG: alpha/beta fold hydrolase [Acidimicrobiales bacterium]